ncbi:putative holin-like toxin [Anaerosporobacter sp.]
MNTMEILTFCLVLFAFGSLLIALITLIIFIIQLINKK